MQKKTWEGIRDIIKVSTKNRTLPTRLKNVNEEIRDLKSMADKFNEFYINIGNMVEAKIPKAKSDFSSFLKTLYLTQFF